MADEQNVPSPDDTAATDAAVESSELDAARRERDDMYDRLLRKTAEFDNYRKRVERERRSLSFHGTLAAAVAIIAILRCAITLRA